MVVTKLKTMARAIRRGGDYPVAVPQLPAHGGQRPPCLALCDGMRTMRQVGVPARELLQLHDEGKIVLWRRKVSGTVPATVEHVILSPHPDDAPLSASSVLLNCAGVMVVTVFSKTAWWRFGEVGERLPEVQRIRVEEERLMARLAGARLEVLDLPEALLRGHGMEDVFIATPTPTDQEVMHSIRNCLREMRARWPAARWYIPLGIGNHLDHRLVRDAALAELKSTTLYGYEDLPYAAEGGAEPEGLPASEVELFACPVRWKLELLRVYWSQFAYSRLAPLQAYARKVGSSHPAERLRRFIQTSL